ncbi:MAG: helix-turn-helix transcriptional regulator [Clostridiales bacterium]|nr:helix-turn-helix transcriptional regulator [Clostridiales bacterium]
MENLLAIRLNEFIKELEISKAKFAEKVGVSAASISDWTNGNIQPTAESIYLICKAFDISADYLLGLKDEI